MMQKINPKFIQLIGDLIIPLIGYFYWNWSLYFIVVFLIIDLIIKEIYVIKKSTLIIHSQHFNQQNPKIKNRVLILTSIVILSIAILFSHLFFYGFIKEFKVTEELYKFVMYKELGIPQCLILIPLLFLGGNLQFKMEFIKPKQYLVVNYKTLWKKHITTTSVIVFSTIILTIINKYIYFGELFYLLTIITGILIYRSLQLKNKI